MKPVELHDILTYKFGPNRYAKPTVPATHDKSGSEIETEPLLLYNSP